MSEASPEAWLSERSGAAPPSDSSLRRMLRLQGQEATAESAAEEAAGSGTRGSGGMASGGSGGMAMGAERPRASRHAPGEARQPGSGACQGGVLGVL